MKDFTDIITVLDRSGSMSAIKLDMEGGFNTFMRDQQSTPGAARHSLYQFDNSYEAVYENRPLAQVPPLCLAPRGATALLDAVGRTIAARGEYYAGLPEAERPERVVFVIITDGEENSSVEYRFEKIKAMVTRQREVYGWQFVFLGANIDAVGTGASLGIPQESAMDFDADPDGVQGSYASLSRNLSAFKGKLLPAMCFTAEDRVAAKGKGSKKLD